MSSPAASTPADTFIPVKQSRATSRLLARLLASGKIKTDDQVLVIASSEYEEAMFRDLGFANVRHTNLGGAEPVDACAMPYADNSFDLIFIEAALHHMYKPHLAIYEMLRVTRRSIIICETQDHWLMNLMMRAGLAEEYELSSVRAHHGKEGGVNNTHIPNFVYRWAPGELAKVFKCLDPTRSVEVDVEYAWDLYGHGGAIGKLACAIGNMFFSRLANCFALHYDKSKGGLKPWLARSGDELVFREAPPQ